LRSGKLQKAQNKTLSKLDEKGHCMSAKLCTMLKVQTKLVAVGLIFESKLQGMRKERVAVQSWEKGFVKIYFSKSESCYAAKTIIFKVILPNYAQNSKEKYIKKKQ
jgi:hypothetical protein